MWRSKSSPLLRAWIFQSTHPAWDVTTERMYSVRCLHNFNPHIPHGMWRDNLLITTLPIMISIHTSRMGCDSVTAVTENATAYFNPHIPHGMWHKPPCGIVGSPPFQSTHPAWDVTERSILTPPVMLLFQSTHPAWDVTWLRILTQKTGINFNPHIPHGMWHQYRNVLLDILQISIHTSRMGCDGFGRLYSYSAGMISIHTSRMGCDGDKG